MALRSNLDTVLALRPRHRAGLHGQQEPIRDKGNHESVQCGASDLQCLLPARLLDEWLGLVLQLG